MKTLFTLLGALVGGLCPRFGSDSRQVVAGMILECVARWVSNTESVRFCEAVLGRVGHSLVHSYRACCRDAIGCLLRAASGVHCAVDCA
jgi:hypothetical protein